MIPAPYLEPVSPHLITATLARLASTPQHDRTYRALPALALASGASPKEAALVFVRLTALEAVFKDPRWSPYARMIAGGSRPIIRSIDECIIALAAAAPMNEDTTFCSDSLFAALLLIIETPGSA